MSPVLRLGLDLVLTMHSTVYSGVFSFVRSFSLSSFVCLKHAVLRNDQKLEVGKSWEQCRWGECVKTTCAAYTYFSRLRFLALA